MMMMMQRQRQRRWSWYAVDRAGASLLQRWGRRQPFRKGNGHHVLLLRRCFLENGRSLASKKHREKRFYDKISRLLPAKYLPRGESPPPTKPKPK